MNWGKGHTTIELEGGYLRSSQFLFWWAGRRISLDMMANKGWSRWAYHGDGQRSTWREKRCFTSLDFRKCTFKASLDPRWNLGREIKEIMTLAILVGVGSWYYSSEICGGSWEIWIIALNHGDNCLRSFTFWWEVRDWKITVSWPNWYIKGAGSQKYCCTSELAVFLVYPGGLVSKSGKHW